MAKSKKNKEQTRSYLADLLFSEYETSKRNQDQANADFEAVVDLLDNKRNEKDYDWQSDVSIPEFAAIFNTEQSLNANQYFASRDFVEARLEGDRPDDLMRAKTAKKVINKTLNRRDLNHYQKYMRLRAINGLNGSCYAVCGWDQNVYEEPKTKMVLKQVMGGLPEEHPFWGMPGAPPYSPEMKFPVGQEEVPQEYTVPHVLWDHFDYEVIDPRNIFTDNSYVYSVQDKDFVIIRSQRTVQWIKDNAEKMGFSNLDEVERLVPKSSEETDTSKESFNRIEPYQLPDKILSPSVDMLDRYGKIWAVVKNRSPLGAPIEIESGVDSMGQPKESAEMVEAIVTMVLSGSQKIIIRDIPSPFVSSKGKPYRPIVRGLCYIHPIQDVGMSDGKYSREMQVALNDTINQSNDRVKLATLPTFLINRYAQEDNDEIYFEPEHGIPVNDVNNDFKELRVSSDISGALNQATLFIQQMQQVNAVYPTTMGDMPNKASTTATASADAANKSSLRNQYKSYTFEYTFLNDFYWMILQMSHQFMRAETAMAMLGPDIKFFDPDGDYTFQPVTSSIETEQAKANKVKNYDQILGRIQGLVQISPQGMLPIVGHILSEIFDTMGGESAKIAPLISNLLSAPKPQPKDASGSSVPNMQAGPPASNQNGLAMSGLEQNARGMM